MDDYSTELQEFERQRIRLGSLLDEDPAKAVEEARRLPVRSSAGQILYTSLKASTLIDAGSATGNRKAIEEGIALFESFRETDPEDAGSHYNLGNGLVALADLQPYQGFDWYLTTAEARRKARWLFQHAASRDTEGRILSRALTNLGNAFSRAHRWVEAYDAYGRVLEHDGKNGVALTGAAKILLRCIERGIGNAKTLRCVAARHLSAARQHPETIKELVGSRAHEDLAKLFEQPAEAGTPPDLRGATDYEKFVARYRLALSPTIEGLDRSLKRWDSLRIRSFTEPVSANPGVPALFAMFNVLKSDFLAARYLAYQALSEKFTDSGFYSDTLDYAVYGVVPSTLTLAQRACFDVLDKIAVATSECLAILRSEKVYFSNRWFRVKKGQPREWHPALRAEVEAGNTAIIALAELSLDVEKEGALHEKKAYRHASTHRFTVLHDMGSEPSRPSPHIEHCGLSEFRAQLIESLQMARAAVLYFVEMISIHEAIKKPTVGRVGILEVPSHHWIRGEDDDTTRLLS